MEIGSTNEIRQMEATRNAYTHMSVHWRTVVVDEPVGVDCDARVHEIGVAVARRRGDLPVGECRNNPSRQAPEKETNRKRRRKKDAKERARVYELSLIHI